MAQEFWLLRSAQSYINMIEESNAGIKTAGV